MQRGRGGEEEGGRRRKSGREDGYFLLAMRLAFRARPPLLFRRLRRDRAKTVHGPLYKSPAGDVEEAPKRVRCFRWIDWRALLLCKLPFRRRCAPAHFVPRTISLRKPTSRRLGLIPFSPWSTAESTELRLHSCESFVPQSLGPPCTVSVGSSSNEVDSGLRRYSLGVWSREILFRKCAIEWKLFHWDYWHMPRKETSRDKSTVERTRITRASKFATTCRLHISWIILGVPQKLFFTTRSRNDFFFNIVPKYSFNFICFVRALRALYQNYLQIHCVWCQTRQTN